MYMFVWCVYVCVCVCVCVCIYIYIYIHTYTHVNIRIHAQIHTCTHTCAGMRPNGTRETGAAAMYAIFESHFFRTSVYHTGQIVNKKCIKNEEIISSVYHTGQIVKSAVQQWTCQWHRI
jgi:hypothetical protein